jgi:aminoglycoside 3-N-acetyltransferase
MSVRDKTYTADDVAGALRMVGVTEGDVLFSHMALGPLGLAKGCRNTHETCALVLEGVRSALGSSGTFVVPTYTYSFTDGEDYDPATTPSAVGPFTEYFRSRPGVVRSRDPIFSVAAEGPMAEELVNDLPASSFGADCVYDRLWEKQAVIANFCLTIEFLTFLHYVEEEWNVPYRYSKAFEGRVRSNDAWHPTTWQYYVRVFVDATLLDLGAFRDKAVEEGTVHNTGLGRGFVEAMRCRDIKTLLTNMLDLDPWCHIKGPASDVLDNRKSLMQP